LEVFKPSAFDGVAFSRQLYIDSLTRSMWATLTGVKTIADTRAELLKKVVAKVREAMGSLRQDESKLRHERPRTGWRASGEVVMRAPWLTSAYHMDREATRTLWEGGYLHRQDIGTIGTDGYLQVVDRLKDVIKTGGEWHDHTAHRAPARNARRQRVSARKSGAILYANRLALIACRHFRNRSSFS
jgi:AMP-binding enzyme